MRKEYVKEVGLWAAITATGEIAEFGTKEEISKLCGEPEEDDYPNDAEDAEMLDAMFEYYHGYSFDDDRH